ncbi:MAG: putative photosynthetic complex assembly protein PuhE, partial [Roseomonas sp.]
DDLSAGGIYLSFVAALCVCGAIEISFLGGIITGPNRGELPQELLGFRRFWAATRVVLWHELLIFGVGLALFSLVTPGGSRTGFLTFLLLWLMRLSAKLNLYLGVRNTGERLLPAHLAYMSSYFSHRPMNLLFPFSITLGTILSAWLFHKAFATSADEYQMISFMLIATLSSLAVVEHWFFMLPLPLDALWRWGVRIGDAPQQTTTWSTNRTGPFDTRRLAAVLAHVTAGAFGSVETLRGSIRSPDGWLTVDFVDGIMHLGRHCAPEGASTGITVTGRLLDEGAIYAEFDEYALRYSV